MVTVIDIIIVVVVIIIIVVVVVVVATVDVDCMCCSGFKPLPACSLRQHGDVEIQRQMHAMLTF